MCTGPRHALCPNLFHAEFAFFFELTLSPSLCLIFSLSFSLSLSLSAREFCSFFKRTLDDETAIMYRDIVKLIKERSSGARYAELVMDSVFNFSLCLSLSLSPSLSHSLSLSVCLSLSFFLSLSLPPLPPPPSLSLPDARVHRSLILGTG